MTDGPGRTNNRSRSPRFEASGRWNNVDKGRRQIRFVTSGKELALKVGSRGPATRGGRAWCEATVRRPRMAVPWPPWHADGPGGIRGVSGPRRTVVMEVEIR